MKTLVLSMISIAATVAAMTACTSESGNDPINEIEKGSEINITANVLKAEVETKAAVTGNALEGVQILRKDAKTADAGTTNWETTPIEVDIVDASTNIFNSQKQYYKPTGENAYFIGFYPKGSVDDSGVVTFTSITGKEDVLLSNELNAGARGSATSDLKLTFSHKLALIKFTFKQGTGYPADDQVTSLTVKGAELPATMKLSDGTIAYTTDKAATGISAFAGGSYTISSSGSTTNDADALMIEPGKDITLDITTSKGSFTVSKVKINGSDSEKTVEGKQYNISITFNAKEASANATINPWGDPISGEGTTE
ncbi:fimbrillin family protein [Parabacteroides sp. AF18-52]|mgnify:CR=1 FL=1|uniref:fimbrillin family protein n=1 Tax=Parabacteroides TaxID=375288 RepID=UPI000EFE1F32|nr:fimbrillin family protein [Parabacteroides sp. AF18-52]RHR37951.1 fimbrillin family protein [Parabacteroides sp. AF18-52]